jgi:DNA-binding Lrp family transcriptional regulator
VNQDTLPISLVSKPKKEHTMVTSIILLNVERTKINEVAEQLAEMEGISEVYSVSGKYDLIVIVRVKTNDDLAALVTKKLLTIDNILKSETMLAFKAFSRHDLEAMFNIGMK